MNQHIPAQRIVTTQAIPGDSEFLRNLGGRIRRLREQRGLARKVLARNADVSERYLAQLEVGEGNISIVLLRRVAVALGTSLSELLNENPHAVEHRIIQRFLQRMPAHRLEETIFRLMRDLGARETAQKGRVALIGLRGAGKSTLGTMLADDAQVPFIELDRAIEQEAGISLNEVFMLYGQSGYRRLERRCLERIVQDYERAVIAVGGGIVSETETYNLLLSKCFTVWLRAQPEEHMGRVAAQGDYRPMEGNEEAMEDLRRILAAREPLYAKADATVDTSGKSPQQSLSSLRETLAP